MPPHGMGERSKFQYKDARFFPFFLLTRDMEGEDNTFYYKQLRVQMENQRAFPRLSEHWEFEYRSPELHEFEAKPNVSRILNISGSGLCFNSTEQLPNGALLPFELKSTISPSPIIGVVSVVWSKKGDDAFEQGAKFVWVKWKDIDPQIAIANYVNTHH
jgi:hypothetical protein